MTHPSLVAIEEILARAQSRLIRSFLGYIRHIHPADRLPGRRAIDPAHIPDLLGNVVLVEVQRSAADQPPRFFVRIAGEAILAAAPAPMMNRYLDTLQPASAGDAADVRLEVRQRVLQSGLPYYWRGPPRLRFRLDYGDVEYVHCPLADDGFNIDRIFSAFHYSGSTDQ